MVTTSNSRPTSSTEMWNIDSVTFAASRFSLLAAGNKAEYRTVSMKNLITRQQLNVPRHGHMFRTARLLFWSSM